MKNYTLFLTIFAFTLLGFNTQFASAQYAPGCTATSLYSSTTGSVCNNSGSSSDSSGFWDTLTIGSRGATVRVVQQILKDEGFLSGRADGRYGNRTARAVREFQDDNDLPVTGNVDTATLAVLRTFGVVVTTPPSLTSLTITTDSLLPFDANVGYPWTAFLAVSGIPSGFTSNNLNWSVLAGALPPGLSLSASDNGEVITGIPTQAGTFNFYLTATTGTLSQNNTNVPFVSTTKQFIAKVNLTTITVTSSTIVSGGSIRLNFVFPSNTVRSSLYLACPAGVNTGPTNVCNTHIPVTSNTDYTVILFNTTSQSQNVVPNYYVYTSDNPNYANGVTSQITVTAPTSVVTPSFTITSPTSGQVFTAGSVVPIRWTSQNVSGGTAVDVQTDSGSSSLISQSFLGNPGTYDFTLSSNTTPGAYVARVRGSGGLISTMSSMPFTVTAPTSVVPAPTITLSPTSNNGGSYTIGSSTIRIGWTANNFPTSTADHVNVYLVPTDGSPRLTLALNYWVFDGRDQVTLALTPGPKSQGGADDFAGKSFNIRVECQTSNITPNGGNTCFAQSIGLINIVAPTSVPTATFSYGGYTSVNPPVIVGGGSSAQLIWSSTNAVSCEAFSTPTSLSLPTWTGSKALSGTQSFVLPVGVLGPVSVGIRCSNSVGTQAVSSVSFTAASQPTINLSINGQPASLSPFGSSQQVTAGQPMTFSWSSVGATGCSARVGGSFDAQWTGTKALSGTQTITIPADMLGQKAIGLYCFNLAGADVKTGYVTVVQPVLPTTIPVITFNINNQLAGSVTQVTAGTNMVLAWTATNADYCEARVGGSFDALWTGEKARTSGTQTITVPANMTGMKAIAIQCRNTAGWQVSNALFTVVAPVVVINLGSLGLSASAGSALSSYPAGCLSSKGYSVITGKACSSR